jgi:AcrR family transcriptional regulator
MARVVKEEIYAAKRNEILDVAQRLVFTKGYDQMSIQDILNELQISKGAFYHYFSSKAAVLEALIERIAEAEVLPLFQAIVNDPHLSAIEKLQRYFDSSARWKAAHKPLILGALRILYSDENALFRQKMLTEMTARVTPLMTSIIRQGIREGVFTTTYPDQAFQVITYILQGMSDMILGLFLADEADLDAAYVETTLTDYVKAMTDAVERILGAHHGSLRLIEMDALMEWFGVLNKNGAATHEALVVEVEPGGPRYTPLKDPGG